MGNKVHPIGFRLGIVTTWKSVWYAKSKDYANYLEQDILVRSYLEKKLQNAGVSSIQIERLAQNARITVKAARPGIIIGRKGSDVEELSKICSKYMKIPVRVNIAEVKKPELDATIVANNVAQQLERRVMYRRAMKRAVQSTMKSGALGIKICVSGRLGGAEIARSEWYREGRVPLHTLRADIDFAISEAMTTYGIIGVKIWIFRGEILKVKHNALDLKEKTEPKAS